MDKREDFYEIPLCPQCNNVINVIKSQEEWGVEFTRSCRYCGYEDDGGKVNDYRKTV